MNRDITMLLEEAQSKMSGYVALFAYRLGNLCIKAEPVSLLSIDVLQDGSRANFEDVAEVLKPDDYHFIVVPKNDGMLLPLAKSIKRVHPEFKLETKSLEEETNRADSSGNNQYLYLEMPEVNKDRHDVLKEATEILYNNCKTKEDAVVDLYLTKISAKLAGYPKEAFDRAEEQMEIIKSQVYDLMNKNYEAKLSEIESAYEKYLKEQKDQQQKQQADDKAHGINAGMSIKLFREDDD